MGLDLGVAAIVKTLTIGPVGGRAPTVAVVSSGGGHERFCEDAQHSVFLSGFDFFLEYEGKPVILRLRKNSDV